jgi:hypothetical protein
MVVLKAPSPSHRPRGQAGEVRADVVREQPPRLPDRHAEPVAAD